MMVIFQLLFARHVYNTFQFDYLTLNANDNDKYLFFYRQMPRLSAMYISQIAGLFKLGIIAPRNNLF